MESTPKIKARVCIIGNGSFANKVHYPSLASFDDVEIAGILAFDEGRLRETAQRSGIPLANVYTLNSPVDYQKILLALQPDGVYVIGKPEQMLDIWIWCLRNKFNIYIEKPPGLTLHQATMLAYLAQDNNCITQVSFQRRCSPLLQKMKEACAQKGAINHAMVEFYKYDITPMTGARDRMLDDYIHCVDTARWLCGGDVIKIESIGRNLLVPDINFIGAALHFDNGAVCYAVGNWSSGRRIFRVNMHAPGICADTEPEKEAYLYSEGDDKGVRYEAAVVAGSEELFVYGGFRNKHREFIDSILSGTDCTSSPFSDALKTMKVCENILAQTMLA